MGSTHTATDTRTRLRKVIDDQGRKQRWVAQQAGMAPQVLSDILTGRRPLRFDEAITLARLLDVPVETFAESGGDE